MTSSSNSPESPTDSKATKLSLASFPLARLVLGGVLLIGLVATVLLILRGTDFCVLSVCSEQVTSGGSLVVDFWSFAGGAAALLATVYLGLPLLPAVGVAAGVWFLMYSTLHLGH
jgi:hypothetical protein